MQAHELEVLELVATLWRGMAWIGNFDGAHPQRARAVERLHRDLVRALRTAPEIALVPTPPAFPDSPRELHVDGTGSGRVDLRRLVPVTESSAFVQDLLAWLDARGIALLAVRRAITVSDLTLFFEQARREGDASALAASLRGEGSHGFAIVAAADVPSFDAPWAVRVALARLHTELTRDGAAIGPDTAAEAVNAALHPFLRHGELLPQIFAAAPVVEPRLDTVPSLRGASSRGLLAAAVPTHALHVILQNLQRVATLRGLSQQDCDAILEAVAARLTTEPPTPDRDRALRGLLAAGHVTIGALPTDLRDRVEGERWVDALETSLHATPPVRATARLEGLRQAVVSSRFAAARVAFDSLRAVDRELAEGALGAEHFAQIGAALTGADLHRLEDAGALMTAGGLPMAIGFARWIATVSRDRAEPAARMLGRLGRTGADAARAVLSSDPGCELADLFLRVLYGHGRRDDARLLAQLCAHASPAVRRDALSQLAAVDPAAAGEHVVRAFADGDPSVRVRALSLADAGIGRTEMLPRAMDLLLRDASRAEVAVTRAAADFVASAAMRGAAVTSDVERALCQLVAPVGVLGKLVGRSEPPLDVVVAGAAALASLDTDGARRALARLATERGPTFLPMVEAARRAAASRRPLDTVAAR